MRLLLSKEEQRDLVLTISKIPESSFSCFSCKTRSDDAGDTQSNRDPCCDGGSDRRVFNGGKASKEAIVVIADLHHLECDLRIRNPGGGTRPGLRVSATFFVFNYSLIAPGITSIVIV